MASPSQHVQELSISLITNLSASIERKRQKTYDRRQELVKAREQVSSTSIQYQQNEVVVHIGDGYHVSYPPRKALESLDRMIFSASKFIAQCDKQIESAKRAVADLQRISGNDSHIGSSTLNKSDTINALRAQSGGDLGGTNALADAISSGALSSELDDDPFLTEEGLPIMEIMEELDEDGNITSSQVRPQKSVELAEFANKQLAGILEGRDDLLKGSESKGSTKRQFIDGRPVFGPEKPEWLLKGLPNPHEKRRISAGIFKKELSGTKQTADKKPQTDSTTSPAPVSLISEKSTDLEHKNSENKNQSKQPSEAAPATTANKNKASSDEKRGVENTTTKTARPDAEKHADKGKFVPSVKIPRTTDKKLKLTSDHPVISNSDSLISNETKNQDHQSASSDDDPDSSGDSDSSGSQPPDDIPYNPDQPAIPTSELLELEILANDIEEESDFEGDEAAFDLTEDGGDEDGDNDEDEDAEEEIDEDIDDVEDDDDDEDEFGRTRGSLVPSQYASRIQEEIAKLRAQGKSAVTVSNADSAIDDQEEYSMEEAATSSSNDDSDSNIIKPPKIKEKKRVRFSETIEIKRFEKNPPKKKPANSTGMISPNSKTEPIKDAPLPKPSSAQSAAKIAAGKADNDSDTKRPARVSKFKLERMESGAGPKRPNIFIPNNESKPQTYSAVKSNSIVSDTVLERDPNPSSLPPNAIFKGSLKRNAVFQKPKAQDGLKSISSIAQPPPKQEPPKPVTNKYIVTRLGPAPAKAPTKNGHSRTSSIDSKNPSASPIGSGLSPAYNYNILPSKGSSQKPISSPTLSPVNGSSSPPTGKPQLKPLVTSTSSPSRSPISSPVKNGAYRMNSINANVGSNSPSPVSSPSRQHVHMTPSYSSPPSAASFNSPPPRKPSRFKIQVQTTKGVPKFPVSSRIQELESYQLSTDKEKKRTGPPVQIEKPNKPSESVPTSALVKDIKEKDVPCDGEEDVINDKPVKKDERRQLDTENRKGDITTATTATSDPIEKVSRDETKKADVDSDKPVSETATNGSVDIKQPKSGESAARGHFDTTGVSVNPALIKGLRSMFPQEVLDKANDYYEGSLMSEADFIRAHLGDEADNEVDAKADANKDTKKADYKAKPVLADTLVEREDAPDIDGIGMGYLPDRQVKTLKKKVQKAKQNKQKLREDKDDGNENGDLNNDNDDDDDDDDDDYTVSRAELLQEYQKVRQTLIYQTGGYGKSPEELETEPVEEPVRKASRFKMARLSNRRL